MAEQTFDYKKDASGIVTLTMATPNRSINLIDRAFLAELAATLDRLEADQDLRGVILTSGKKHWLVGADIEEAFASRDPQDYFQVAQQIKSEFRRLECLGRPVVAALNGTALGGGLELALACHYRISVDQPGIQFGFPEVGLGLLPAGGGVIRTVRLLGLELALEWLAQNKKYSPAQALQAGILDELAADRETLQEKARNWLQANPEPRAPWDQKGFRISGGGPDHPQVARRLAIAPAYLRQQTRGNFPAPHAIMAAAVEGARVDFETACRIESRYFARLATGQVSRNMVNAFWFNLNQIKKGGSRPPGIPPQQTRKIGVLGAGMMGHGIAYVAAAAGMQVVLTDVDESRAQSGRSRIAALLKARLQQGRLNHSEMEAVLSRIQATADYADLQGCDLIIEAVFEERDLKAQVTRKAATALAPGGVLASNTSTLPISELAEACPQPEKFIGLHFFSPVHKMKLVEIILGKKTAAETLAKAFDFVLALAKVPIVVNDSRGFYTSRVFFTWSNEGMALLAEGQHPQAIEMAGMQAGMPVGPLAVLDEVSLSLAQQVRAETAAAGPADQGFSRLFSGHPGFSVLDKMLEMKRPGRAAGAGFYEYGEEGKRLWPGLADIFMDGQEQLDQKEMIDRFLFVQALESVRCLEEGVINSAADANIGSIFGWGFPPFHGGTLQFINACGLDAFLDRARELARQYGPRFEPPRLLLERAARGEVF